MKGREREAIKIRRANRASAVGRLFLNEVRSWQDFLNADSIELETLPRRNLKAASRDVRMRLSKEIDKFCKKNFTNMSMAKLSDLYEEIKAHRGLENTLVEFENKYSAFRPNVLRDIPYHATVSISLWGLQFKFPEDFLAKDVVQALSDSRTADDELKRYKEFQHIEVEKKRDEINLIVRRREYASRTGILCCFNLIEAYLNGIAWNFSQNAKALQSLSNNKQKLIRGEKDATFKNKLIQYPEIIGGKNLWKESEDPVNSFLSYFKPFRDSLVHPSPFSVPQKFGGYDKLRKFYNADQLIAKHVARLTYQIIVRIHLHLNGTGANNPAWLDDLQSELRNP